MAGRFVLTAELKIQAINIRDVAREIRRELRDITIDVSIEADTRSLEDLERRLDRTRRTADDASSGMEAFGRNAGLAAKRFAGFTIATAVVVGLGRAIKNSVGEAIAFERELVKISQVTGKTTKDLKTLSNQVTQTATSLGVASSSLLEVSRTLAQAGLTAQQTSRAMSILAKTDLAPTFNSLKDTTEGAIAILRQFGSQGRTTMKDIGNLEKQLGAINAVSKQFAVESADLITAVRRTGGVFKSAGGNLNELLGLFTSVRATTRESAETIATGFRTIFTRIQRVETIDQLKQLGIELQNAKGQFVGPMEAIKRLSLALKSLDPKDFRFNQIVEQLGGFRQIGKVIPLIQQNATAWRAYGVAQRGANSLASDAMKAQAALAVQVQKVREQFAGLIRKVADSESFRTMADIALKLASAFIKVADALLPLMPMLTTLATLRIGMAVPSFMKGLQTPLTRSGGGKVRGYAGGGMVPGTGSRDTVPAMLTPGEFVVRKSSVKKHGTGNLERLNRHAGGGRVRSGRHAYGRRASALSARGERIQPMMADAPGSASDPGAAPLGEGAITPWTTGEGKTKEEKGRFERDVTKAGGVSKDLKARGVRNNFGAIFLRPSGLNENLVGKIPHDRIISKLGKKKGKQVIPSTGLSGGSEFQFNLRAMSLPGPISKKLERNIYKSVVDGVENSAEDLNRFLGVGGKGTKSKTIDATFLKNMNIDNVVGNMFEGILSKVGMPWGEKATAGANWDFPKGTSGAGGGIKKAFEGIGDSPSDAKSTFSRKNLKSILEKAQADVIAQLKKSHQTEQTAGLTGGGLSRKQIEAAMGLRTGRGAPEARANIASTGLFAIDNEISDTKETWRKLAKGGRVDSVPALLTPGEFVINKSSASKIGSGNLNRLNQVGAFATGGPVGRIQTFQGGGGVGGMANVAVLTTMFAPMIASMAQFDGAIGKAVDTMVSFGGTLVATKFAMGSILTSITAQKSARAFEKTSMEISADSRMTEEEKSQSLSYAKEKETKRSRRAAASMNLLATGIGVAVGVLAIMQKIEKERMDKAKEAGDVQAAAAHASKAAMMGMTKNVVLATGGLTAFALMLLGVSAPFAAVIAAGAAVAAGLYTLNNDFTGAGEAAATRAKIETEVMKASKNYEKALKLITSKNLEGAAKAAAHNAAVEQLSQKYDTLKQQADRYSQAQEGAITTLLRMVGITPGETDMQQSVKKLKGALSGSESEIRSGISAIVQAGVEAGDGFAKISSGGEFVRSFKNLEKIFISLGYTTEEVAAAMQSVRNNAEEEVKQKAAMQAAAKAQNTAFLALRRKTDILRMGLAGMADAARDAKLALSDLSEIAALASGGTAQTKRVDPSSMFKDITNVGDIGRFAQGAQEAGALFGKAGIEIANEATGVAKGFKVLPELIQDIGKTGLDKDKGKQAVKDIIGNRLDHLPKEIKDRFIDKLTALAQQGKLKRGMGAEAVDALVQEVSKDFKSITDLLAQAQKRLTVHINGLGKGFKQLTDLTLQRSKAEMQLVGTFDKAVRTIAEATGQKLTLADKDAMRTARRGVGLGRDAGMANDPAAIGGALRNTQKRIIAANKALQKFSATGQVSGALAGQYLDQVRSLEKLKERSRRLSGALKDLQNQSARLSDIQGELEQAKQERMARQNLLKEWTFATNDGRKEINQSFAALSQAMRAGDIDSIPDEMRPAVKGILDQFQDVELFGGMTGKDISKQFQVRVLDKMMRAQGMGGVNQQQVKQIFEATPKEERLINELRSTFMMEGAARAQWIATLGQQENQVMSSIFQMHQDFVARLQSVLNNIGGAGGGVAAAGGGVGGAAHTVTMAKGGSVLYRSGGGGTDTVPAMLTPGEFVMNKSAVGRLGVSNLRRMNAKGYQQGGLVGGIGGLRHHSEFEIPEGEKLPLEIFSPEDIDSLILRNAKTLKIKGPLRKLLKKIRRQPQGLKTLSQPFTKIFGDDILKGGAEYYTIQKEFHEEFQKHNLTLQKSSEGLIDMTVPGNLSGVVGTLSKLGRLAQKAQRGQGAKDLDQLTKGQWSSDYSKMEGLLSFQYHHFRKEALRKKSEARSQKAAHKPIDSKPKTGSGEQKLIDEFGSSGKPAVVMPYNGWNPKWNTISQQQFRGSSPFGNTDDPTGQKAYEFVMGKDPAEPGGPKNRSFMQSLAYGTQHWNDSLLHRWKYANVGGGGGGKNKYYRNTLPQGAPQDIATGQPVIGFPPKLVIGQKYHPHWTADPLYGWREDPGAVASRTTRPQDMGSGTGEFVQRGIDQGGISASGGAEDNTWSNTPMGRWWVRQADWLGFSGGGPVYKAEGGSIFKPRGTDTVPAMLTPGEFVVRKAAVDKIGVSNLQSLNSGGTAVPKKTGGIINRLSGGGKALYAARGTHVPALAATDIGDVGAWWHDPAWEKIGTRLGQGSREATPMATGASTAEFYSQSDIQRGTRASYFEGRPNTKGATRTAGKIGGGGVFRNLGAGWVPAEGQVVGGHGWQKSVTRAGIPDDLLKGITVDDLLDIDRSLQTRVDQRVASGRKASVRDLLRSVAESNQREVASLLHKRNPAGFLSLPPSNTMHPQQWHALTQEANLRRTGYASKQAMQNAQGLKAKTPNTRAKRGPVHILGQQKPAPSQVAVQKILGEANFSAARSASAQVSGADDIGQLQRMVAQPWEPDDSKPVRRATHRGVGREVGEPGVKMFGEGVEAVDTRTQAQINRRMAAGPPLSNEALGIQNEQTLIRKQLQRRFNNKLKRLQANYDRAVKNALRRNAAGGEMAVGRKGGRRVAAIRNRTAHAQFKLELADINQKYGGAHASIRNNYRSAWGSAGVDELARSRQARVLATDPSHLRGSVRGATSADIDVARIIDDTLSEPFRRDPMKRAPMAPGATTGHLETGRPDDWVRNPATEAVPDEAGKGGKKTGSVWNRLKKGYHQVRAGGANRASVKAGKDLARHSKNLASAAADAQRFGAGAGATRNPFRWGDWTAGVGDRFDLRRNPLATRGTAGKLEGKANQRVKAAKAGQERAVKKQARARGAAKAHAKRILDLDRMIAEATRFESHAASALGTPSKIPGASRSSKAAASFSEFLGDTYKGAMNVWGKSGGRAMEGLKGMGKWAYETDPYAGRGGPGSLKSKLGKIGKSGARIAEAASASGKIGRTFMTAGRGLFEAAGPAAIAYDWWNFADLAYQQGEKVFMTGEERDATRQAELDRREQSTLSGGWDTRDSTLGTAWAGMRAVLDTATMGGYSLVNMALSSPLAVAGMLMGNVRNPVPGDSSIGMATFGLMGKDETDWMGTIQDLQNSGATTDVIGDWISVLGMVEIRAMLEKRGKGLAKAARASYQLNDNLQIEDPLLGYVTHDRSTGQASSLESQGIGLSIGQNRGTKSHQKRGARSRHKLAQLNDIIFEETMKMHKKGQLGDKFYNVRPGAGREAGSKHADDLVVPYMTWMSGSMGTRGGREKASIGMARRWLAQQVYIPKKLEEFQNIQQEAALKGFAVDQGQKGRGDLDPGIMLGSRWHQKNSYETLLQHFADRNSIDDPNPPGTVTGFVSDSSHLKDQVPLSFVQDNYAVPKYLDPAHKYLELPYGSLGAVRSLQEKEIELMAMRDIDDTDIGQTEGAGHALDFSRNISYMKQVKEHRLRGRREANEKYKAMIQKQEGLNVNEGKRFKKQQATDAVRRRFESLLAMQQQLQGVLSGGMVGATGHTVPKSPLYDPSTWDQPFRDELFEGVGRNSDGNIFAKSMLSSVNENMDLARLQMETTKGRSAASDKALELSATGLFSMGLVRKYGLTGDQKLLAYYPEQLSTHTKGKTTPGVPGDSWVFGSSKEAGDASKSPPFMGGKTAGKMFRRGALSKGIKPGMMSGSHPIRFDSDPSKGILTGYRPTKNFAAFLESLSAAYKGEQVADQRQRKAAEGKKVSTSTPGQKREGAAQKQLFLELQSGLQTGLFPITGEEAGLWKKGESIRLHRQDGVFIGDRSRGILDEKGSKDSRARIGKGSTFTSKNSRFIGPQTPLSYWMRNDAQHLNKGGGVDTVPAMLTPGEFIMSKGAVGKYGTGFMKSLNRGGIPGYNKGGMVQYFQGPNNDVVKPATGGGGGVDLTGIAEALMVAAPNIGNLMGVEIAAAFKVVTTGFSQATGLDDFVKNVSSSADKWGSVATKLNDMHMHHTIGFKEGSVLEIGGVTNKLAEDMAGAISGSLANYVTDIVKDEISKNEKKKVR